LRKNLAGEREVNRRGFFVFACGALAARGSRAQRVYRVGFLGTALASGYVREVEWVRSGLRDLGYVEGRNIVVEYRWAEGDPERAKAIAAEFVALKVDAIVVHGVPGALAAVQATSTIPIVMADSADPVAAGLIKSLARPGGNITGSTSFVAEEVGKRLQLIKELVPGIKRAGYLFSAPHPAAVMALNRKQLEAAAGALKVGVEQFEIRDASDLPEAFNAMERARVDAVLINSEPLLNSHAAMIAGLAAVKRIPAVGYASYADAGGMLGYGANRPALYRRTGYFLDRIFKGANAGDIAVERATKFDVVVNLKAAKALGAKVPQSLLLRADRVLE
jgi:putative ABC transport system substrate-binding protein